MPTSSSAAGRPRSAVRGWARRSRRRSRCSPNARRRRWSGLRRRDHAPPCRSAPGCRRARRSRSRSRSWRRAVDGLTLDPIELALVAPGGRAPRDRRAVRRDGPDRVGARAGRTRAAPRLPDARRSSPVPIPADVGIARRAQRARTAARRRARTRSGAPRARRRPPRSASRRLRDASLEQVADDPIARHVVTENARVEAFARALRRRRPRGGGRADAREPPVAARRLRGVDARARPPRRRSPSTRARSARGSPARASAAASSRSSTRDELDAVAAAITDRYRAETGREPNAFAVSAVDGAGLVDPPTADLILAEERMPTIFSRIISGELPGRFVWRDDRVGRVPVDRADAARAHARRAARGGRPLDRPRRRPRRAPVPGRAADRPARSSSSGTRCASA